MLKAHNLKAFVPIFKKIRTGIIKDVPTELSDKEIKEAAKSPFQILEAKRFRRKVIKDGSETTVPTTTVLIKFAGQILPKYMYLFKIRFEVSLYIPRTKTCFKCYRIGHIAAACKSRARCLYCGLDRHEEGISCSQKIIHTYVSIAKITTWQ